MNNYFDDTIVALATPGGVGAISIIRLSGPNSFKAIDSIFKGKKKISECDSHTIHYGKIFDKENNLIDDVLVFVYHKPNSYTGEDSVEISIHGNPLIAQKIIELLISYNLDLRLAEPGEFTKRAFLNGKMDLAQAEAVAEVINSRTEASFRGARNQLDGILSQKVQQLKDMLINSSSLVELELDFVEEDIEFISYDKLINQINSIIEEIDNLLNTYSFGRVIREGVNVALVGIPNVGKSSLLNYILKESRAIVSHIPGTTRDIIREEVSIDGILFRLYDTAGIRFSEDEIEKEGVMRSREAVKNADIVLFINDIEQGFSNELYSELLTLTKSEKILIIFNKVDLINFQTNENINSFSKLITNNQENSSKPLNLIPDVFISAKSGYGINNLFSKLKEKVIGNSNYTEKTAIVSNLRHFNSLKSAKEYLINAKNSATAKLSGEFIAVDLRNAINSLGEIIGEVTSDDILNNIFSKFCIGK